MPSKVLSKVMGIFGLEDEYEELEEEDEVENQGEEVECSEFSTKKQNKVVNIHTATSTKVVIIKPQTFDEAAEICEDLKNRKIVVVNTINLETKVAQRLLDFMGGASYVLGGNLQEVEKSVYVLSPSNVVVSNDLKHELSSKGIFNFNR